MPDVAWVISVHPYGFGSAPASTAVAYGSRCSTAPVATRVPTLRPPTASPITVVTAAVRRHDFMARLNRTGFSTQW